MGTLGSSSNIYEHPTPPPFLRLPLIISENLRSAVSSDDSSTKVIVSILLSGADLAKLDLSKLQLFSVDGFAMDTPSVAVSFESTQTGAEVSPNDTFLFQTPLILSPVSNLPPSAVQAFPILKSKGVVDAEKATAEHNLLKLGAVSPSPRARKKAVSMDDMSLNEQLSRLDIVGCDNLPESQKDHNMDSIASGGGYGAKMQLPALELTPLPCPGLEQKAETLKKKHFERVLSRKLSEVRNEEAKIDLKASPAAKFLLQVMPWELTPPITPVTTPAAIPFIWEDVPGRPKPRALSSPCPTLPLPPRLLLQAPASSSPPPSSDSSKINVLNGNEKQVSHGRTHRKNMHSWHVLHNIFSGNQQGCPMDVKGACPEDSKICMETTEDGPEAVRSGVHHSGSDGFSSANSNGISSSLSSSNVKSLHDGLEPRSNSKYELPPLYVAPVVPLTPPHKDLAPLTDDRRKKRHRFGYLYKLFHKGRGQRKDAFASTSFFNRFNKHGKVSSESNSSLLEADSSSALGHGVYVQEYHHHGQLRTKIQNISVQELSPLASTLYRSPKRGKPTNHRTSRSTRFFIRLRMRGTRVVVASYRAIKRALILRRGSQSKLSNHSQLQYYSLQR